MAEDWDQVNKRENIKYLNATKEEGLESKNEVKANEIEMTNFAVCEGALCNFSPFLLSKISIGTSFYLSKLL